MFANEPFEKGYLRSISVVINGVGEVMGKPWKGNAVVDGVDQDFVPKHHYYWNDYRSEALMHAYAYADDQNNDNWRFDFNKEPFLERRGRAIGLGFSSF